MSRNDDGSVLIEVDSRGRTNLGKLIPADRRPARFVVREGTDGTLILEPANVIPEVQARLLRNSQTRAALARANQRINEAREMISG